MNGYFETHNTKIYYDLVTPAGLKKENTTLFLWAHGWGQDHRAFQGIKNSLLWQGSHLSVDFPGFGRSDLPPDAWDSRPYAEAALELIRSFKKFEKVIWIGHSFGCRVGLRAATDAPSLINALCLISAPGIPYPRPFKKRISLGTRKWLAKTLRKAPLPSALRDNLRQRLGSADYKAAGALRPTLIKILTENLTTVAKDVPCPTLLIYGDKDTETPPVLGTKFLELIPNAQCQILKGYDHYSILSTGSNQVVQTLHQFINTL